MSFTFTKAKRKAVPLLIAVSSGSGGGKTYSSLLLAAGLAGKDGKVFLGDTENGRGEMYSDSPGIVAALPNGFMYGRLDPPFSPERYAELVTAAEKAGADVLVLDSWTHEWEGLGGCCDIAENNKLRGLPNWSKAKMAHKRLMNHLLSSKMHIIFSIRAREKVKIVEVEINGQKKTEIVPIGLQAVTEKAFMFEATVSLQLDELTHFAKPVKVPEPLAHLFPGAKLLTKEDGERIRQWNETGQAMDPFEHVTKRARAAAEQGMASYTEFFKSLNAPQKKALAGPIHEENKRIAAGADTSRLAEDTEHASDAADDWPHYGSFEKAPDPMQVEAGAKIYVAGNLYENPPDRTNWRRVDVQ